MPASAPQEKPVGRIRQKNELAILAAAETEFARHGYKGTSMSSIAATVGLPKANLHYYFGNKQGLYRAVLGTIIQQWNNAFEVLDATADPAQALSRYIRTKLELSRTRPQASRIFAMEVISGGANLAEHYNQDYRRWFAERIAVFQGWIDAGLMAPVDPAHLVFMLWGSTQHYADFAEQICLLTGRKSLRKADFEAAAVALEQIILRGCGLQPPTGV